MKSLAFLGIALGMLLVLASRNATRAAQPQKICRASEIGAMLGEQSVAAPLYEGLADTAKGSGVEPEKLRINFLVLESHATEYALMKALSSDAAAKAFAAFLAGRVAESDRARVSSLLKRARPRYTAAFERADGHGVGLDGIYQVFRSEIGLAASGDADPGLRLMVSGLWSTVSMATKEFCDQVQKTCPIVAE